MLEVTTLDRQDRRRRGKNDDLDAQERGSCCLRSQRTVTPRSCDGMIELLACRKTAVAVRRIALQMIQNTVVCAPDALRDHSRNMTQLIRTLAHGGRTSPPIACRVRLSHQPQTSRRRSSNCTTRS